MLSFDWFHCLVYSSDATDPHEVDAYFRGNKDPKKVEEQVVLFYEQGLYTQLINETEELGQCHLGELMVALSKVYEIVGVKIVDLIN